jgi:hypothetical protein
LGGAVGLISLEKYRYDPALAESCSVSKAMLRLGLYQGTTLVGPFGSEKM